VHKFYLSDAGFHGAMFGRGVAFAFAVTGPAPFEFDSYGWAAFGPNCGIRVYGDPFVAARQFYVSVAACDPHQIGISYARFYVGEYVRYPSYLCVGWHEYHGVRSYCRSDCAGHRYFRVHAADPYRVLDPRRSLKYKSGAHAQIARIVDPDVREVRPLRKKGDAYDRPPTRASKKVVSSKDSFVMSKKNISTMRQQLRKQNSQRSDKSGAKSTSSKTTAKTVSSNSSKVTKKEAGAHADGSKKDKHGAR
jgi:hypothetical protein